MPGSRAAGLGQDHQRFLQDHDERARARPAGQAARDAAVMDSNARSDLRVLVRLFPGHDGQSDDRVLQQPRDRPARDLPADFCRGYRGPKIACWIEPLARRRLAVPFGVVSSEFMHTSRSGLRWRPEGCLLYPDERTSPGASKADFATLRSYV